MVVVTDGGDTTSYKHYGDALAAAQRADVVLYPVVVVPIEGDAGRNTGGEHALATLAASTGGRIFNPEGFEQLDEAFAEFCKSCGRNTCSGFIRRRARAAAPFHPVRVEIHASLRVTARTGYYEP